MLDQNDLFYFSSQFIIVLVIFLVQTIYFLAHSHLLQLSSFQLLSLNIQRSAFLGITNLTQDFIGVGHAWMRCHRASSITPLHVMIRSIIGLDQSLSDSFLFCTPFLIRLLLLPVSWVIYLLFINISLQTKFPQSDLLIIFLVKNFSEFDF